MTRTLQLDNSRLQPGEIDTFLWLCKKNAASILEAVVRLNLEMFVSKPRGRHPSAADALCIYLGFLN